MAGPGRTGRGSTLIHSFVNDLLRPVGTYLYGRRMYGTMVGWETVDSAARAPFTRNFADADVVFSNSRNLAEREGFGAA